MKVIISSKSLERKLAQLAILKQKGLDECVQMTARLFTERAIKNTMPMVLRENPSTTRRKWEQEITKFYTEHRARVTGYMSDATLNKLLREKKKQLGREAAGWNAAATKLKARGVPSWVKRHGLSEGAAKIIRYGDRIIIKLSNRVPYNEAMTLRRAKFALQDVERGVAGNLRILKRKLLRSVK